MKNFCMNDEISNLANSNESPSYSKETLLAVSNFVVSDSCNEPSNLASALVPSGTQRVANNLEVLKSLAGNSGNSELSPEILSKYSGWGGLREAIFTPAIYRQLKAYLSDEQINSIKRTLNSAYYTPQLLVKFMWAMLGKMGFKGGDVLEPAVGMGAFLDYMPEKLKMLSNICAVEIDKVTCELLLHRHPQIFLGCTEFENFYFGNKKYDLVISNPPYSNKIVSDIWHRNIQQLVIHHFFVAKSAILLKDGGLIAMVVPQFFWIM